MLEPAASRCARQAGVFVVTVVLAAGAVFAATPSADAQGLFEALLGRSEPSFAPTLTIPLKQRRSARDVTTKRKSPARSLMPKWERNEIGQHPQPYRAPEVMPGPVGQFLRDPALRRGDVVVTVDGLMVFRGPGGARHRANQFVTVSQAGPLIASRTKAELAKVLVATRPPAGLADSPAPIVAKDDSVRWQ